MDPWFVVAVIVAVAAVAGLAAAARSGQELARVRTAAGGGDDRPSTSVTRIRSEAELSERQRVADGVDQDRLLETLGSGVIAVDRDGHIRAANPAAHTLLARAPGTLPGRTLMEAFLDPTVEAVARAALETGTGSGEIRLAGIDGPALVLRARSSVGGGLWLVLEDVSELRRLQRIRAEFIDNLSHELRTPLTTVSLLAETLSREAAVAGSVIPAKMRDRIGKIEVETGHLVQMVNELLDLTRIESGGTLRLADGVDLGRMAAESAERLRLFADRQGVTLSVENERALPPVRGDVARLGQVVVNLVHNAVKFSPDGGDVTVRTRADGDEVVVSVEDHGVGIPKAAQDRVFERFYKVDRARLRAEAGGGTGLGLAIARHVIDQHGGRIWVESDEGVGSTFAFALPVAHDHVR